MVVKASNTTGKKRTNDKDVYREIFEAILSFRLKPGTKLTEENLSKIFGVGRTTIRNALLRLSHDHIVEIEPNKGAFIANPSTKQAKEILRARKLIEVAIVKDVIKNATAKDYDLLKDIVASEKDHIEDEEIGAGIRLSGDFHLLLAKVSTNVTLERIVTTLVPQTSLVIVQYERPDQPKCSHLEHFELIEVMEKGDVEKATSLMAMHIQGIEDKLKLDEREVVSDLEDAFRQR